MPGQVLRGLPRIPLELHAVTLRAATACPTLRISCRARLNDCPRSGHTYAPCLLHPLVGRPPHVSFSHARTAPATFRLEWPVSGRFTQLPSLSFRDTGQPLAKLTSITRSRG